MDHHAPRTDADDAPPGNRARPDQRRSARDAIGTALAAASLIQPLACLTARLDWRADLLTHFPEPALGVTAAAFLAAARRRRRLAIALALLAIWQAVPLIGDIGPSPVAPAPGSTARVRLLLANVLCDNGRYDLLAGLIRAERPDVVGLVECTPEWIEGLAEVRREFPHRLEAPDHPKGLALWFREPPTTMDPPRSLLVDGWPVLHAAFDFAGRERHIWLVHPSPPQVRKNAPELEALARDVVEERGSRIVLGDLNSTSGSPHFGDFLAATGLRDSRVGIGRQASWPTWSPYRIAIDHAFVSDDLAVVDRRLGSAIGSDHFPMILDLAPSAGESSRTRSAAQPE